MKPKEVLNLVDCLNCLSTSDESYATAFVTNERGSPEPGIRITRVTEKKTWYNLITTNSAMARLATYVEQVEDVLPIAHKLFKIHGEELLAAKTPTPK